MALQEDIALLGITVEDIEKLTPDEVTAIETAAFEKKEIARVSKQHNQAKVLQLKVPLDDTYKKFAYGYIKYPDRVDVSIGMTMQNTDPLKGKEIVLRNNWLEGDEQILEDTETFLSACTVLDEVLAIRQAIVKKNY